MDSIAKKLKKAKQYIARANALEQSAKTMQRKIDTKRKILLGSLLLFELTKGSKANREKVIDFLNSRKLEFFTRKSDIEAIEDLLVESRQNGETTQNQK